MDDPRVVQRTGLLNTPIELISTSNSEFIAVDGTHVYYPSLGTNGVYKVPIAGGNRVTLATSQVWPLTVAVDGTHVYWQDTTSGTILKTVLSGGTVTPLATGQNASTGFAIDATHVYWVNVNATRTIHRVPIDGGSPTTLVSISFGGMLYVPSVHSPSQTWSAHTPGAFSSADARSGCSAGCAGRGSASRSAAAESSTAVRSCKRLLAMPARMAP